MKKLLLLVGLILFSNSLLAKISDVRGVKLVCVGDTSKLQFYAFAISEENFHQFEYRTSYNSDYLSGVGVTSRYLLYPKKVVFKMVSRSYVVDRKTLELYEIEENTTKLIGQCMLTTDDPFDLMETVLEEEIKKQEIGNKF